MADIVVVGGGIVGLSFALAVHQQGFEVEVFDLQPGPVLPDSAGANVVALGAVATDFLSTMGVLEKIPEDYCTPYTSMTVYDGTGVGEVRFSAADAGLDCLGHIIDQRALRAALAEAADAAKLKVYWETAFDHEAPSPSLLIASDGAHSKVRERLRIPAISYSYHQTANVCTATLASPHAANARQWFQSSGPVAFLPLSAENQVAVVWSCAEDLAGLSEADFIARLIESTEQQPGDVLAVGPRFSFPLMQLQAMRYVQQGVALLGDAAHAIHPLAGQGANLGFADALVLSRELATGRLEGFDPGDLRVLKRYQRARQPDNYLTGLGMEGFHRLFGTENPLLGLLRSRGMRFVQESDYLKRLVINAASGRV